AVVVGVPDHELDVQLVELLTHPVEARFRLRAGAGGVEVEDQRLAGFGVAAVRVTGFGEELLRLRDRFSLRPAVDPVVDITVDPGLSLGVAEDAGWDRALHRDPPSVPEDGDRLFLVDGDADRLSQLPGRFRISPHHRIEHVEPKIEGARLDARHQTDSLFLHLRGQIALSLASALSPPIESV